MINSFNSESADGSKYSLSEKEKELGFVVADVEVFSISDPDCFERSAFLKLSDSDALFKEWREDGVIYSHRRWGSKPNQSWNQWSPVQNPFKRLDDAIANAHPNIECPLYHIERSPFNFKEKSD